jgi:hypothetical protein
MVELITIMYTALQVTLSRLCIRAYISHDEGDSLQRESHDRLPTMSIRSPAWLEGMPDVWGVVA